MPATTNPEDIAAVLEIGRQSARLSAHFEFLDDFVRRLGRVADRHDLAQFEIPVNTCSLAELADTLDKFAGAFELITPSVRRLEDALPREN